MRPGEIVTLIGPNGAGKSTILKSIIGQLERMGGTVRLVGKDMAGMKEREIARHLSVMMTERIRPELMTCKEVVSMGRYPYTGPLGVLGREDRERVEEALSLVRAEELADWGRRSRELCFTVELPRKKDLITKISGGDALRGHTRTHPEHDG